LLADPMFYIVSAVGDRWVTEYRLFATEWITK
jgi:hypothetical protein